MVIVLRLGSHACRSRSRRFFKRTVLGPTFLEVPILRMMLEPLIMAVLAMLSGCSLISQILVGNRRGLKAFMKMLFIMEVEERTTLVLQMLVGFLKISINGLLLSVAHGVPGSPDRRPADGAKDRVASGAPGGASAHDVNGSVDCRPGKRELGQAQWSLRWGCSESCW
ncbi:unnamed protein product [Prorocentrum cordatum]|uniref:Uncharacterized protein n=1 Tax=Prorocentrum cordatum TaxID=2364126 RepID=A0ABN9XII9_9DINO|nr:unnamed protein product [Polarella glacialis]